MAEVPRAAGRDPSAQRAVGARGPQVGDRGPQGAHSTERSSRDIREQSAPNQQTGQSTAPERGTGAGSGASTGARGPAGASGDSGSGESAASSDAALLEDRLRRALADLDNLRKRFDRELVRQRAAERALVVEPWVAVVDNLERALQHADTDSASIIEGVRAVRDQALTALAALGFPRFDDVGQTFDPQRHEAVAAVENDAPPGTIVDVVRPGYGTPEVILRPAAVVVARRPD